MPGRNLFFFAVVLGLEINYLVISYFMGKKNIICVCIAKSEGKEVKLFSSCVSSGRCLSVSPWIAAWTSRWGWDLCQSVKYCCLLPSKSHCAQLLLWLGDPHITTQLILDCSVWWSLAPKSKYITRWYKALDFLLQHFYMSVFSLTLLVIQKLPPSTF